jgi:drug/metabolite transporter (DMT)-like permease
MPRSNFALFAICVLIWGSTWIAITFQLGTVAPELSVGYRFLIASLILFAYCRWRGIKLRFNRVQHGNLFLFGMAMFCVSYICVYHAELYIISGMVAVAYSASPLINMFAARIFFGTPLTLRLFIAASLGIIGIVCVFWQEFAHIGRSRDAVLGAALTAASVLLSCMGAMVALRTQKLGIATWPSMAWGMFYGGCGAIAIGLFMGRPLIFTATPGYIGSLLYLALLGSIVTFGAYLTLLSRLGAARATYVGVMVPIVALVISVFFEKFAWGWLTTVGVALSVLGNVLMLRKSASPKPSLAR